MVVEDNHQLVVGNLDLREALFLANHRKRFPGSQKELSTQ